MTHFRLYLLGLLLLFGAFVALEYYRPRPLNWQPTLSNKDKIPYGTYALYDVLPQLLGTGSVESVRLPVYNQLFKEDEPDTTGDSVAASRSAAAPSSTGRDSASALAPASGQAKPSGPAPTLPMQPTTYFFIANQFAISQLEGQALLAFVAAGNDVFIAAEELDNAGGRAVFADSLGVRFQEADSARTPGLPRPDSVLVRLVNPALGPATLRLPAQAATARLVVRGGHQGITLATDAQGRAVLLRLNHGRGQVYLCSVPIILSNYYVLAPRHRPFALGALSYLPTGRPVWWDEYQKQGRLGEQSVLRVLLAHDSLRTAYYLLWVTAILFIVIEARRRQRIIPVSKPLPNTTLLFTRTVASLYQQGRSHNRIAEKKVSLFLDYLRSRFHEPAPDLGDDAFRERLSQKAGLPRLRIDELLRLINFVRTAPVVTDRELLTLSRAIRDFKQEST
ncbi:DUF4350 domain-containing protein [Hymenobacter baengnokdamensis]|uniref:DUF4350 domain-containing protein n=1 Tax=Hymenobacter baengnokdamensis TaxID=2615203 RepID=UPI001248BB96|nr:DUF4350 domain-containing protein [Hymenobacter baengnokdamensis]